MPGFDGVEQKNKSDREHFVGYAHIGMNYNDQDACENDPQHKSLYESHNMNIYIFSFWEKQSYLPCKSIS